MLQIFRIDVDTLLILISSILKEIEPIPIKIKIRIRKLIYKI